MGTNQVATPFLPSFSSKIHLFIHTRCGAVVASSWTRTIARLPSFRWAERWSADLPYTTPSASHRLKRIEKAKLIFLKALLKIDLTWELYVIVTSHQRVFQFMQIWLFFAWNWLWNFLLLIFLYKRQRFDRSSLSIQSKNNSKKNFDVSF